MIARYSSGRRLADAFPSQLRDAALNMLHIKRHYYGSHPSLNSLGIIPAGSPAESTQFSGSTPQYRLLLA
jgi:glutathionyl-hydroquinone reductase